MNENNDNVFVESFFDVHQVSQFLHINEKKIYALAKEGKLPGTKVTGKWLFPKKELEAFIEGQATQTLKRFSSEYALHRNVLLVAGSDDPAMYLLQSMLHSRHPEFVLFSASLGSGEGLRLLRDGFCHIALSHLYDHESGEYNFPFIERHFEEPDEIVVINMFYRSVGFLSRGRRIRSFNDIAAQGLRFINRQAGSGIRHRIDALIEAEGVDKAFIKGFDNEVYTHTDVSQAILSGQADAGIAAESVAHLPDVSFSRLFEERFDMLVRKSIFFEKSVQTFIDFVRSPACIDILEGMQGYSTRETGRILYSKHVNDDKEHVQL